MSGTDSRSLRLLRRELARLDRVLATSETLGAFHAAELEKQRAKHARHQKLRRQLQADIDLLEARAHVGA